MKHYANYLKEREGLHLFECAEGFATYQLVDDQYCYIIDIYVCPESRKSHVAGKMADAITEIAKNHGCPLLYGSVCPGTAGDTASLKVLLAYGFRLASIDHQKNLIMFQKEI